MKHPTTLSAVVALILIAGLAGAQSPERSIRNDAGIQRIKALPAREAKIAIVWGDHLQPPAGNLRSIINLRDAMMKWTDIPVFIGSQVRLGSSDIHKFPILFVSAGAEFDLSETEKRNLRDYIRKGGFVVADAAMSTSSGASTLQLVRDIAGNKRMEVIPSDHPIFQTPFQLDGPPRGSESEWRVINESMGRIALNDDAIGLYGVFIDGRLAVLYSQKGYYSLWNDSSNDAHLKFGVNLIMYAITGS